jgi:hypothetical protein
MREKVKAAGARIIKDLKVREAATSVRRFLALIRRQGARAVEPQPGSVSRSAAP